MAVADRPLRKLGIALFALGAAFTPSLRVCAEPTNAALAESLFQEGRRLMTLKKYAEACPKLAESQQLDPATGTLLNLAVCHENEGKLATAWVEFNGALSSAHRDRRPDREQLARDHIATLEPRLSRLTLVVPETARVSGLEVKLDGTSVGAVAWGLPTPIDPGSHELVASAPGRRSWSSSFEVKTVAAQKVVEVPVLVANAPLATVSAPRARAPIAPSPIAPSRGAPAAPVRADRPVPPPGVEVASLSKSPSAPAATRSSTARTAAYVVGGVGVAALGVGSIFGLRTYSKWSERNANCRDDGCNTKGLAAADAANTASWVADVGFVVGAAAVATGVVLWVRSRSPEANASAGASAKTSLSLSPSVGPGSGGMVLGGAW